MSTDYSTQPLSNDEKADETQKFDDAGNCNDIRLQKRRDGSYYCVIHGEKDSPTFIVSIVPKEGESIID